MAKILVRCNELYGRLKNIVPLDIVSIVFCALNVLPIRHDKVLS